MQYIAIPINALIPSPAFPCSLGPTYLPTSAYQTFLLIHSVNEPPSSHTGARIRNPNPGPEPRTGIRDPNPGPESGTRIWGPFLCKKKRSWIYSRFAILVRKLLPKPWDNHGMFWLSRGFPKFSQNSRGFQTLQCTSRGAALLVLLRPDYAPESQAPPPAAHWTGFVTGRSSKKT